MANNTNSFDALAEALDKNFGINEKTVVDAIGMYAIGDTFDGTFRRKGNNKPRSWWQKIILGELIYWAVQFIIGPLFIILFILGAIVVTALFA